MAFDKAGTGLPDLHFAIGKASNNEAELFAIGAAVEAITMARRHGMAAAQRAYVMTDSNYSLGRLQDEEHEDDNGLLRDVRRAVTECRQQGPLSLIWVPGHVGVEGNERADALADEGATASARFHSAEPSGGSEWSFITDDQASEIRRVAEGMAGA